MQRTVLLALCLALAGCSDGGNETPDNARPGRVGSTAEAPVWTLGDWWSVSDSQGRAYSIVVAGDNGGDWLVLSNDLSVALADHTYDISYLGNVRKSDLAGQQGSDRPKYFDWPLADNKTWTTTWDGASRTMSADLRNDGRFLIQGHDAGVLAVEYIYNPAKKWLDELRFYNLTSEEVMYGWQATGSGNGYSGSAYRYTEVAEAWSAAQQGYGNPAGSFPIGDDVSELVIAWNVDCVGVGYMAAGVQPPNEDGSQRPLPPTPPPIESGETYGFAGQCPDIDGEGVEVVAEPMVGTWRVDSAVASSQGGYQMTITKRTYETLTF